MEQAMPQPAYELEAPLRASDALLDHGVEDLASLAGQRGNQDGALLPLALDLDIAACIEMRSVRAARSSHWSCTNRRLR